MGTSFLSTLGDVGDVVKNKRLCSSYLPLYPQRDIGSDKLVKLEDFAKVIL
jgi:hypothetical protein